jgi:IS5 family transposase
LLKETIEAAHCGNVVKVKSFEKVIVDTTVMEKAVANPTDSRLLERGWLPRQDVTPMPSNTGA